jgi:hypothetical protein
MSRSDLWPPLGLRRAQLTDQGDKLGAKLRMTFTALDLFACQRALPFSGALEFGHHHRLVELRDGAEYGNSLARQVSGRQVLPRDRPATCGAAIQKGSTIGLCKYQTSV